MSEKDKDITSFLQKQNLKEIRNYEYHFSDDYTVQKTERKYITNDRLFYEEYHHPFYDKNWSLYTGTITVKEKQYDGYIHIEKTSSEHGKNIIIRIYIMSAISDLINQIEEQEYINLFTKIVEHNTEHILLEQGIYRKNKKTLLYQYENRLLNLSPRLTLIKIKERIRLYYMEQMKNELCKTFSFFL